MNYETGITGLRGGSMLLATYLRRQSQTLLQAGFWAFSLFLRLVVSMKDNRRSLHLAAGPV